MAQEAKVVNPDRQIDCTGLFCPMPIVKTREAIPDGPGRSSRCCPDDPASDPDMRSWARNTGHELLGVTKNGGSYHFVIRKTVDGGVRGARARLPDYVALRR
jgi:TusA-related sulfurtransferase